MVAISPSNSMGGEAREQIKMGIEYFPHTKKILLTVSNVGKNPVKIYNPDWKSSKVLVPDFLRVKTRNKNNQILSDVPASKEGFITSKAFVSSLIETPVEPIILEANKSVAREFDFRYLIMRYEKYLPESSEFQGIKFKYSLFFDEQLRTEVIHTTDWLPFKEK